MDNHQIQSVLRKEGITKPTLIQRESYEAIRHHASAICLAKTGTGKTLAYALPTLAQVQPKKANQLVILAPTTELAVQIRQAIAPFLSALKLHALSLVGAGNRKRQLDKMKKRRPEVIVATPGRLWDFISSQDIQASQIKMLVIDEADDLLEFAKLDFLTALGQNLGPDSQILLFGATASPVIKQAEELFQRHFLLIDVRSQQTITNHHCFLQVDNQHKLEFLQRLIHLRHFKGIVFFDSNQTLLRFAGIFAHTKNHFALLSNQVSKKKRAAALQELKAGRNHLLLATDLAARGLDIPGLTYVVNYNIPRQLNTYLHRAGRTGRMNQEGWVITLGDDHDFRDMKKLLAGHLPLRRVYFAGDHLTTKRSRLKNLKKKKIARDKRAKMKRHGKRRHKNKGYHPHFLKGKK